MSWSYGHRREAVLITLAGTTEIEGGNDRVRSHTGSPSLSNPRERPGGNPGHRDGEERRASHVAITASGAAHRDVEKLQAATSRADGRSCPMSVARTLVTMYASAEDGRTPCGVAWSCHRRNRLQGSGHGRSSITPIARSLSV